MGYTTEFDGEWTVTPTLKPEHVTYLNKFADTRRMKRDATKTAGRPDPLRGAVGLPVGPEGAYFVGAVGHAGQEDDGGMFHRSKEATDILDYNGPPTGQPDLWCQWEATEDGAVIKWNGRKSSTTTKSGSSTSSRTSSSRGVTA